MLRSLYTSRREERVSLPSLGVLTRAAKATQARFTGNATTLCHQAITFAPTVRRRLAACFFAAKDPSSPPPKPQLVTRGEGGAFNSIGCPATPVAPFPPVSLGRISHAALATEANISSFSWGPLSGTFGKRPRHQEKKVFRCWSWNSQKVCKPRKHGKDVDVPLDGYVERGYWSSLAICLSTFPSPVAWLARAKGHDEWGPRRGSTAPSLDRHPRFNSRRVPRV
ncbi:hypothetical protein BHE74_00023194, partial [Ensete ventricosum]